ncbi:MAG: daunorubicin/doxorubicin resistance ABC transporter ATP-binding protein DrrA, partial [Pseudonocardiaceae bacterium]
MPAPLAAVEVRGLVRSFGTVRAVDGLDLRVPPATVLALLGPNGAGKTTT